MNLDDTLRRLHAKSIDNALELVGKGLPIPPLGLVTALSGDSEFFLWRGLTDVVSKFGPRNVASVTLVVDTYIREYPKGDAPPDELDLEQAYFAGDSQVVEAIVVQTVLGTGTYHLSSQPYGRVPDVHVLEGHVSATMDVGDVESFNPFLLAVAEAMRDA